MDACCPCEILLGYCQVLLLLLGIFGFLLVHLLLIGVLLQISLLHHILIVQDGV